jgi:hypothetical protein
LCRAVVCFGALVAVRTDADFNITGLRRTGDAVEILHPSQPGFYYIVSEAAAPGQAGVPVAIWLSPAGQRLVAAAERCIYWVHQIPEEAALDTDADGIDDAYELEYAVLDPLAPADAATDPDGDGDDCLTEYRQGRNPAAPATPDLTGAIALDLFTPLDPA